MSFLSRILPAPDSRLEDAIAQIAEAQRVEPITLEDRLHAVRDALRDAPETDIGAVILGLLSVIKDSRLRLAILAEVQADTWKDVKA